MSPRLTNARPIARFRSSAPLGLCSAPRGAVPPPLGNTELDLNEEDIHQLVNMEVEELTNKDLMELKGKRQKGSLPPFARK
ncbi:hypothetical protein M514_26479 [Trichuris suis]|uniref:Uncharacterized protein n=1 Tax=Trichuris suis TaxID=68888 RepID=A0A085MVV0_9BILA|nr:hypothetical protein M513_12053 [Trichuris suis]KFD59275.1 hypothetical protein M514_28546 [Trichuris suis]KFD61341.1 hypothetical protein M514_12053 [Trichuris suis]KFD61346.1 hypothetical protein M514_26479 [Trichuris suis]